MKGAYAFLTLNFLLAVTLFFTTNTFGYIVGGILILEGIVYAALDRKPNDQAN